jgi:hypothetical protein
LKKQRGLREREVRKKRSLRKFKRFRRVRANQKRRKVGQKETKSDPIQLFE